MFPRKKSFFSRGDLLGSRGWTDELVETLLPEPDILLTFPRDAEAAAVPYYARIRVFEAEDDEAVAAIVRPRAAAWEERRVYLLAKKTDKRLILLKAIEETGIQIEMLNLNTLKVRALETFYERNAASGRPGPDRLEPETLRTIYLNYAVGQLVDYGAVNDKLPDPLSKAEIYGLIGREIAAKIVAVYPDLAPPANERMEGSEGGDPTAQLVT